MESQFLPQRPTFCLQTYRFERFICSQFWGEMGVESGFDLVVWVKIDQGTDILFVESCTGKKVTT